MKIILTAVLFLTCIAAIAKTGNKKKIPATNATPAKTIYDFKVKSLEGGTIDFSQYKGKKILIVNTASKCGFTPQYAGLEKLYERYKDKLVIVGFPSDNFGGQEYNDNGVLDATISWNFNKFLIDENGNLLAHFDSKVTPESEELLKYLNQ